MSVPVHVPRSPVSTVPAIGLPVIDGACVLGGPAADAATTEPASTARAMTTTLPPIQRDLVTEFRFGMMPPLCPAQRDRLSAGPLRFRERLQCARERARPPHPHQVSGEVPAPAPKDACSTVISNAECSLIQCPIRGGTKRTLRSCGINRS